MNIDKLLRYPNRGYLVGIYLIINNIFLLKYIPSIYAKGVLILFYNIFLLFFCYSKLRTKHQDVFIKICNFGIFAALLLIIGLYIKVSPFSVTPDRWSALFFWSRNLLQGIYPYAAHTHMGGFGSPFPIWQIIHLPFYLMGDEIFAHIVMLFLLLFFLRKNENKISLEIFIVLLMLSPAYWWEVLVRSDLMNNMLCSMMLIFIIEKYKQKWIQKPFYAGLCLGIFSCTRILLIIPFWIYWMPYLKQQTIKFSAYFLSGWMIGFILPFLPFLIWNADLLLFNKYSPLILQIRQGSIFTFVLGWIMISAISLLWKTFYQYFVVTTIALFAFMMMMFVRKSYYVGFYSALFMDGFDISYFGIVIPFLLITLSYKNVRTEFGNNAK